MYIGLAPAVQLFPWLSGCIMRGTLQICREVQINRGNISESSESSVRKVKSFKVKEKLAETSLMSLRFTSEKPRSSVTSPKTCGAESRYPKTSAGAQDVLTVCPEMADTPNISEI